MKQVWPIGSLCGLSVVLACLVWQFGGVRTQDWSSGFLAVGILSLSWFCGPAPWGLPRTVTVLLGLAIAYVGFQLVPLPLYALRILSPERWAITMDLAPTFSVPSAVPLSVRPELTQFHWTKFMAYAATFALIFGIARNVRSPWMAAAPLLIVGVGEAAVGLSQIPSSNIHQPPHGTYVNRNHFAGLLETVFPFALVLAWRQMPRRFSWSIGSREVIWLAAAVSLAVLPAIAILASNSRMALAACLVSIGVVGWMISDRWTSWVVGLAILLSTAMLVLSAWRLADEPRFAIWRDGASVARAYALTGCGLGSFESALNPFKTSGPMARYDFAHNDYLQLLTELGVIGLMLMLALLFFAMREVWRAAREGRGDQRWVAIACIGAIAAVAVHSLADFNLYIPANAMAVAWVLGLGGGLNRLEGERYA